MLPNDRAQPATRDKQNWPARLARALRAAPTWLKVTVVAAALLFFPVTLGVIVAAALAYAVVAVAQGRRTAAASASVAVWGLAVFSALSRGIGTWLYSLLLLPFAVALAAHARPLARWFAPCRTVAWVLAWSVPVGVIALRLWPRQQVVGTIAAWLLAAAVLGWRVAKGLQDARMLGRGPAPAGYGARPGTPAGPPGSRARCTRPPRSTPTESGPRRRRCRTPSTPRATIPAGPARRASGRRSPSPTPWPNSTR